MTEEMPTREAHVLIGRLQREGLTAAIENQAYVVQIPFDLTTNQAWRIEDVNDLRNVVDSMIAEGVPVRQVEG